MRPVMCEVADHTPSEVNVAPKERFWGIFVQRTSQRSQWTFQRVSRDCTERSVAGSLLTVFPDAADALDALHLRDDDEFCDTATLLINGEDKMNKGRWL